MKTIAATIFALFRIGIGGLALWASLTALSSLDNYKSPSAFRFLQLDWDTKAQISDSINEIVIIGFYSAFVVISVLLIAEGLRAFMLLFDLQSRRRKKARLGIDLIREHTGNDDPKPAE